MLREQVKILRAAELNFRRRHFFGDERRIRPHTVAQDERLVARVFHFAVTRRRRGVRILHLLIRLTLADGGGARCRRGGGRRGLILHGTARAGAPFLGQHIAFFDQERRIGRDNAVANRERHDFVHRFLVLAVQTNLRDQVTDLARRPQWRDERVPAVALEIQILECEFLRLIVKVAAQRDRRRAALPVATGNHQLRPRKQIGQRIRIYVIRGDAAEINFQIGQHGR